MLRIVEAPTREIGIAFGPAREVVVSWNTPAPRGTLDLRVTRADGRRSGWLPYVEWDERRRRSLSGSDEVATIDLDVVRVPQGASAIDVRASVVLEALAVATPSAAAPAGVVAAHGAVALDVPERSQYPIAHPDERGWCSPAALAMLLAFQGRLFGVAAVAESVRDAAYGGTGNWTFNVAFAGSLGLRGVVAYLTGLGQAERFVAARIPLALSISWREGELPGAALDHSDGHFVVLRGFNDDGDPLLNDPAQPQVGIRYPRAAFERAWIEHGGVAYLVAPAGRSAELERLASA